MKRNGKNTFLKTSCVFIDKRQHEDWCTNNGWCGFECAYLHRWVHERGLVRRIIEKNVIYPKIQKRIIEGWVPDTKYDEAPDNPQDIVPSDVREGVLTQDIRRRSDPDTRKLLGRSTCLILKSLLESSQKKPI